MNVSYDICLVDPKTHSILESDEPHDISGGTFECGGTRDAWLNVTYNYAPIFRRVLGEAGIRAIYGMTAEGSIPVLLAAAGRLDDDVSGDYWDATEGNARRALLGLLELARMFPGGVWDGD